MNNPRANNYLPSSVSVVEVGPRDGLQGERTLPIASKIEFINQLSRSGLSHIESGAFVAKHRVPQMADSKQVLQGISRQQGVCYSALTPNRQGLEIAIESQVSEVAVFTSASEGFCRRNIHCSIEDSLIRFEDVIALASQYHIPVRGYLSCVIDCPYDGPTLPDKVAQISQTMLEMGCYQVSLGDTIGTGTPYRIATMLEAVLNIADPDTIAVHFHDTYGQALANIYQALTMGIHVIDSSTAGLGGCPYAKGAAGNVATEDVLYLCHGLGISTGVSLDKVVNAAWYICGQLNKLPNAKVSLALKRNSNE